MQEKYLNMILNSNKDINSTNLKLNYLFFFLKHEVFITRVSATSPLLLIQIPTTAINFSVIINRSHDNLLLHQSHHSLNHTCGFLPATEIYHRSVPTVPKRTNRSVPRLPKCTTERHLA